MRLPAIIIYNWTGCDKYAHHYRYFKNTQLLFISAASERESICSVGYFPIKIAQTSALIQIIYFHMHTAAGDLYSMHRKVKKNGKFLNQREIELILQKILQIIANNLVEFKLI